MSKKSPTDLSSSGLETRAQLSGYPLDSIPSRDSAFQSLPRSKVRPSQPRPKEAIRSQSDNVLSMAHAQVQVTEEDLQSRPSTPRRTPVQTLTLLDKDKQQTGTLSSHQYSSRSLDHKSESRSRTHRRFSQSTKSSDEPGAGRSSRSQRGSQTWNRALASRLIFDRSTSANDASSSSQEHRQALSRVNVPSSSLQPLRPPSLATKQSISASGHRIKIEKSFTNLRQQEAETTIQKSRRTSSIGPLQFFAVSMDALRRVGLKHHQHKVNEPSFSPEKSPWLAISPQDHQSSLRKHQTAIALGRVSSMLKEIKTTNSRNKTAPDQAPFPNGYRKLKSAPTQCRSTSPVLSNGVNLTDLDEVSPESQSSSLIKLRLEQPLYNTPEERATYTVINQEGNVEEFLRVDISTRGQTSYLPSEARRIHTPPLPSEAPDGRRRGFFFDYNLPQVEVGALYPAEEPHAQRFARPKHKRPERIVHMHDIPTQRQLCSLKANRPKAPFNAADWYDTQLATFDAGLVEKQSLESLEEVYSDAVFGHRPEMERHTVEDDGQLDYTIPEHLPTSPICPRHPRYWRVMRTKGSQFRGCWMHGYGPFSVTENTKYGITIALDK